jgi:MFS family permease
MYNAVQGSATIIGSLLGGFVAGMLGYEALFFLASAFIASALVLLALTNVEKEPIGDGPAVVT